MLTKRIIPCLDVHAGRVVKGINFRIEIGYPWKDAYTRSIACVDHSFDFGKGCKFIMKRTDRNQQSS